MLGEGMFNYQRIIGTILVMFSLIAVISIATAYTAGNTQFMDNSLSFSPAQSNQNVDNQPLESSPFVYIFTANELPTSYTNLWDYSFDQYGKPADYQKEYRGSH